MEMAIKMWDVVSSDSELERAILEIKSGKERGIVKVSGYDNEIINNLVNISIRQGYSTCIVWENKQRYIAYNKEKT